MLLWVVLLAASLALVASGVEWWLRHRAVQHAADRIALTLDAGVELRVVGRPLGLHALRRHLPSVAVVATRVPIMQGRATLERLRIDLVDLRLLGPREAPSLVAHAGGFEARVRAEELLRLVELPPYLVGVDVTRSGLRLTTLAGVVVPANVRLEGTALLVRPAASVLRLLPQPSFRLPLPRLPHGARIEDLAFDTDAIEARGVFEAGSLHFAVPPPRHWWQAWRARP